MIKILIAKAVIQAVTKGVQSLAETDPQHPMFGANVAHEKASEGNHESDNSRPESF
jgi:hypothetical protein